MTLRANPRCQLDRSDAALPNAPDDVETWKSAAGNMETSAVLSGEFLCFGAVQQPADAHCDEGLPRGKYRACYAWKRISGRALDDDVCVVWQRCKQHDLGHRIEPFCVVGRLRQVLC